MSALHRRYGHAVRCTEATLRALGVEGKCPKHGTGVLEALTDAGYKWRPFGMTGVFGDQAREEMTWNGRTLRAFVKVHPVGRYYLSTAGHAMALIDGVLTDTTERGIDGRRLTGIIEVTPP